MASPRRTLAAPLVLTVIGLGAFVTALDQTVVVTALPSVMLDLKVPFTELDRASWIITAYLLGYTVAMPLIGRMGDVYGYSRVYQGGVGGFRYRHDPGGSFPQLGVDDWGPGGPSDRGRRHSADRPGGC